MVISNLINYFVNLLSKFRYAKSVLLENADLLADGVYKANKNMTQIYEKGYYPKSNDVEREDGFINCYKEPEGYYFRENKYYPCYSSCQNCSQSGDEQNNNCISCKSGFEVKNDYEDDYNCYSICPFNYCIFLIS